MNVSPGAWPANAAALEQAVVHAGRTLLAWIPMPHCSNVSS